MAHQVLTQKWRPKNFDQVVGQPHVVRTLQNALTQQLLHHAYLFTGSRGVGKTTIARIIAKCLNCETGITAQPCEQCAHCTEINNGHFPDFFEVDAASRTKVEDTRELLDNVQYAPAKGRFKIYLIDEVHMLSGHSFNALLKTLEEPPDHVKFLLATTEPQKLPPTILSRCLQFHLALVDKHEIATYLQQVLTAENITFDTAATLLLGKAAQGSMRDALSLLDQCIAYGNGAVSEAETKTMLGTIDNTLLYQLLEALHRKDGDKLLAMTRELHQQGVSFSQALADLLSILHAISIQQVLTTDQDDSEAEIIALAQQISAEDVQLYYQIGLIGQRDLALAAHPAEGFEMTLLRMMRFIPSTAKKNIQNNPVTNTAATSNKQPTQTKTTETQTAASSTTAVTQEAEQWHKLCKELRLTGSARALAEQCSVLRLTKSEILLSLSKKHTAFLQEKHVKKIREAIKEHTKTAVYVEITVEQPTDSEKKIANPAELDKLQQQQKFLQAEQNILNDEKVKRMMQAFDATLIKESIVPTNDN